MLMQPQCASSPTVWSPQHTGSLSHDIQCVTLPIETVQVFWRGMILMSDYVTANVIRQSYLSFLDSESYSDGYTMLIISNMRG